MATAAYIGSQGRNLFLRSVANQIVGVLTNRIPTKAAIVVREFSIVTARDAAGNLTAVQNPYAEIDYKTSGGHDSTTPCSSRSTRRSSRACHDERAVHAGQEHRQHRRVERSGDGRQQRADARGLRLRQRLQQLRRAAHVQPQRPLPDAVRPGTSQRRRQGRLLGGWEVGGIVNARSGLPVNVLITRPDIVYLDARRQRLREPGGGTHRDHQHTGRRQLAQRAPAGPGPGRRSVHQGRRPCS